MSGAAGGVLASVFRLGGLSLGWDHMDAIVRALLPERQGEQPRERARSLAAFFFVGRPLREVEGQGGLVVSLVFSVFSVV